jgi:hypothetical protein
MLSTKQKLEEPQFDVVVFLHSGGWLNELTSNRWHYVKFFDQFLDVLIVQPTRDKGLRRTVLKDARLRRTRVVYSGSLRPIFDSPKRVSAHISKQLSDMGYSRPLFWLSTPLFWNIASFLSTGPIVFHATEDFPRLAEFNPHPASSYIRKCSTTAARFSEITLSVSVGVSKSLLAQTKIHNLIQSSNGFAKEDYGMDSSVQQIEVPIISEPMIYCGNINQRIDFLLMQKLADSFPSRTLLLVGPVHLDEIKLKQWNVLLSYRNVHYLGSCSTPQINWLYQQSDTGIIPYTNDPVIVESGFPLKALEMVATGLPVVTSQMKSLLNLTPLMVTTASHSEFIDCVNIFHRQRMKENVYTHLDKINKYSYESEIPRVWEIISKSVTPGNQYVLRQRVRFSLFMAMFDTYKLLRASGALSLFSALTRSLAGSK